ncbi:MAG: hypothetical protein JNM33_16965 [Rubrivivax sp.]|nr:hypothetical protein [Rubrivivax sp.]
MDSVLSQPDRGGWRRRTAGADAALPADWWERLDQATRGRWAGAPFLTDAAAEAAREAPVDTWLLLHPATGRQLRLTWGSDSLVLCDLLARRCERARVETPVLQSLRTEATR